MCWKPSPSAGGGLRPSSRHTRGSRTTNLPLLGSGNAENFLVFIWFSFKCFQRQPSCSTTVPRKLVHVGRSLPENEVICSFFYFLLPLSFSTSPPASAVSPGAHTPRGGARPGRRGGGRRGEGQDPRGGRFCPGVAPSPPRPHPRLPRARPKGELPGGRPRSGVARSANNNSK